MDPSRAARALGAWYGAHARDLPWRRTRDPWAILLSEVLLQQTRAATASAAFPGLLARFPTPGAMAAADGEEVLRAWAGLGYYQRARNLHAAAKAIVARHGGHVPRDAEALAALPGVGPYTTAALRCFAFDEPAAPLDANVLRVLARLTGERRPADTPAAREGLAAAALHVVEQGSPRVLGQALMELGALVCTPAAPACGACPLERMCAARRLGLQEELPVKRPKPRPRAERWAFARVVRDGAVLLERRGPGLLEGFWALPGVQLGSGELAAGALEEHLACLGVAATVGAPSGEGRWAFTHRVWRFTVHPVRVRGAARAAGKGRWVTGAELGALPIAQPHRAFLPGATAPGGRP